MKNKYTYVKIYTVIKMKEEILISDVVKSVDELLLNLETYYTLKNIHRPN